jgi:hypothetical protein
MQKKQIQTCEVTTISAHLLQSTRRRYIYANPAKIDDIKSILHQKKTVKSEILTQILINIADQNPNMIWSVHSRHRLKGLIIVWLLNNFGLYNYFNTRFELETVRLDYFAGRSDPVTAVAIDFIIGDRATFLGLIDVIPWLKTLGNGQLDVWTTPRNDEQTYLAQMLGFGPLSSIRPSLMHLIRDGSNL